MPSHSFDIRSSRQTENSIPGFRPSETESAKGMNFGQPQIKTTNDTTISATGAEGDLTSNNITQDVSKNNITLPIANDSILGVKSAFEQVNQKYEESLSHFVEETDNSHSYP